MRKIHRDVYISLGLLIFCAGAAIKALELKDGAEILPLGLILFMASMALFILLGGIKASRKAIAENTAITYDTTWNDMKKPLVVFLSLVAYGVLFYALGFFVATFLFLMLLFTYLNAGHWIKNLMITLVYEILIYILFVVMLEIPLYRIGIFGEFFRF